MPVSQPRSGRLANALVLAAVAAGIAASALLVALGTLRSEPGDRTALLAVVPPTPAAASGDADAMITALSAPPVEVTDEPPRQDRRLYGAEGGRVGEHPGLSASPIATSDVLIEPASEFRRTVAPGTPLACDRFRPLVRNAGEWDPDVVLAFVWRESQCDEGVVSPTNDWGLMQINATCWAGRGNFGLLRIQRMPEAVKTLDLHCDGTSSATETAKWCHYAKEDALQTGRRPSSPCDAWLDPETNLDTAYQIWSIRGWQPWCFHETSQSTPACQAASDAAQNQRQHSLPNDSPTAQTQHPELT